MTAKKGSYQKVSSSKTGKRKSAQSTQTVSKKRPSKSEIIAYMKNHKDFIFERGLWYKYVGYDGYKGAGVGSEVQARTEKGIKILGEWYPKRFILYHDKDIYSPYWLVLDKKIKSNKRIIDQLDDEIISLRNKMKNAGDELEFSSETPVTFRKRLQSRINDNLDYIKQYQKSIQMDEHLKLLIDER